jgi:hypothetical protein
MARLWKCGFELGSVAAGIEFDSVQGSSGTLVTTGVRSGTYAMQITSLASGTRQGISHRYNATGLAEVYGRCSLFVTILPTADNAFLSVTSGGGAGGGISARLTSTGFVKLYSGASVIGTSTTQITAGDGLHYVVEIHLKRVANGSDVIELRMNGVTEVTTSTGTLTVATVQFIDAGGNLNVETQTQGDWTIDDIALNDTTGSVQNSWPGIGKLVVTRPNAAGEFAATLTLNGAATGWECVDEVPPDDATSTASLTSNASDWTSGSRLMTACQNTGTIGIGGGDTIVLVAVGERSACASAAQATYVLAMQTSNGGTKAESAGVAIAVTAYNTHDDTAAAHLYKLVRYTDPDGAAWTPTTIDSLQIGMRATDTNPNILLTALWAYVEYIPVPTAYTLTVDPGSYALTGKVANVLRGRFITNAPGSYALAGNTANLLRGRLLSGSPGSYAVSGVTAGLTRSRLFIASAGAYTITEDAANLLQGRLLSGATGSYNVTGAAANTLFNRALSAVAGVYGLTGTEAQLLQGHVLSTLAGAYDLTGSTANVLRGSMLSAAPGAYALSGANTGLLFYRVLNAGTGEYTIVGLDATLEQTTNGLTHYVLSVNAGAYALSGAAAQTLAQRTIGAETGSYVVAGGDADLLLHRVLSALFGSYLLDGEDAQTLAGRAMTLEPGDYVIVGNAVDIISVIGMLDVLLTYTIDEMPLRGTVSLTPIRASIPTRIM